MDMNVATMINHDIDETEAEIFVHITFIRLITCLLYL